MLLDTSIRAHCTTGLCTDHRARKFIGTLLAELERFSSRGRELRFRCPPEVNDEHMASLWARVHAPRLERSPTFQHRLLLQRYSAWFAPNWTNFPWHIVCWTMGRHFCITCLYSSVDLNCNNSSYRNWLESDRVQMTKVLFKVETLSDRTFVKSYKLFSPISAHL